MYLPNIAIIDDEPDFVELFRHYFRNDYQFAGFLDYASAVHLIRKGEFDAVMLDIMLPGENGLEILKEIKETTQIPVLMITASKKRDDIISALRNGADDYLEKPFDFDIIRQRLGEALRKRVMTLPEDIPALVDLAPDQTLNLEGADHRVKMVLALIERDFASPLTLHHLSKMLNLAPYYLGRLIKQETGYSFKEILARYRMKRASDMLLQSQQRIKEVARMCGFANFHYFCRMFHRFFGHPASRHRKIAR
jgi:YesN/AraC family two-component response regulator